MRPRLEVFDTPGTAPLGIVVAEAGALDEARLQSYEQGYAAGWDDAVAAQSADRTQIGADLSRALQALSFTYHEAREHVLRAVEPLLAELVGQVVPASARAGLGALVVETLRPLAGQLAMAPIRLRVHPGVRAAVEQALLMEPGLPVDLVADPALPETEARLDLGTSERRIDPGETATALAAAVADFFTATLSKDPADG
ncbi:MAG TPA: flagellar biosynthesis protein [Paracoccaceae bacterium]|nr:flagellar biosynthesis protein [Paracoccaceae bacterium]HMO72965.1 flagellar biosynthesis protein [Paracoccaceae bacterium]